MTIAEFFDGYFQLPEYDGSYGSTTGRDNDLGNVARRDFDRISRGHIIWAQAHGNFKDRAKAALFEPYPYWPQLYEACKLAVKSHVDDKYDQNFCGDETCAAVMDTAMRILRMKYGLNVPKFWLPIIYTLRGKTLKPKVRA